MAHTFSDIQNDSHSLAADHARSKDGNGKSLPKGKPKTKSAFLKLAKVQVGLNVRFFPHDKRMTLMVVYAKPDLVRTATYQVYDTLKTGKTCLLSSSRGYVCLVLNLHAALITTLVGALVYAGNPELVKQIVMMVMNGK